MMTWGELKQEVLNEYDLNDELFLTEDEMLALVNRAIRSLEADIHTITDKYYETEVKIDLMQGLADYGLPTDIYANKITGIYYFGERNYEIYPIRNKLDLLDIEPSYDYKYRFINSTANGVKIRIEPVPRETLLGGVTLHYIRKVKPIVLETDIIDIVGSENFLKQYLLDKSANKERMQPDAPDSPALAQERAQFIQTMTNRAPDDNNSVLPDFSWYELNT